MSINNDAIQSIVNEIKRCVTYCINNAKFNKGVTGRIVNSLGDNQYTVLINGIEFVAKSRLTLQINEIVKIIKWNNSMNELYIIY